MQTIQKLMILSLFFSGCVQNTEPLKPEYVYVKTKVPKQRVFKTPGSYEITDYMPYDDTYIKVNKKQLKKASTTSQEKTKVLWLFTKQAIKFNNEYVNERGLGGKK